MSDETIDLGPVIKIIEAAVLALAGLDYEQLRERDRIAFDAVYGPLRGRNA